MGDRAEQRLRRGLRSAGKLAQRAGQAREGASAEKAAQERAAFVQEPGVAAADRAAQLRQDIRIGHRDGVGHLLGASGRSRRRGERGENRGHRCSNKLLRHRFIDAERPRQAADQLRRKELGYETNKIDRHSFPSHQKGKRPGAFNRLSRAWRALGHRKMSCRRVPPAVSQGNSGLRRKGRYESSGRRAIRTALEKTRTSCPRWLTPRNVLVTRPHLGLEVSRFDTGSTE